MKLLSLDSIIRSYIHENGMVWHDYFRLLSLGIAGLKDLARDIEISSNVKAKEVNVDEIGSVVIPPDAMSIIKVCVPNGDKVVPLSRVDNINPLIKYDSQGQQQKRGIEHQRRVEGISFIDLNYWWGSAVNEKGEFLGRRFGSPAMQPWNYTVIMDQNRIQLDSRLNLKCVTLLYQTNGLKVSDCNMVHESADEAIKMYMDWKFSDASQRKGVYQTRATKRDYGMAKKRLYAEIHGFGYEDYMKVIRDNEVLTLRY